jgi:UDPglucose 6-dehydrogenase
MRIAVFGAGYVGLVAGTCFADSGHDVVLVDVDAERVRQLNEGRIPIYEPGLEELVRRNTDEERLKFTLDAAAAVRASEVVFIAVGTPPDADGKADLKYVLAVAETVGRNLDGYKVVVDKSTVPVGTADKVRETIARFAPRGAEFDVVSNPEFLKEGAAIDDFMKPDRVVVGADSDRARAVMSDLYAPFVRTNKPVLFMDVRSAELTKGFPFLFPGPGYGGSCFPKDVQALVRTAAEAGYDLKIMQAVEDVNVAQKRRLSEKLVARFGRDLKGRTICVWGLSFKPNTDDLREAPSLVLIDDLLARGAKVHVTDPEALSAARRILGDRVRYFDRNYEAAEGCDALVLVTEWNEYRRPDFKRLKSLLKQPVVVDGRNAYDRRVLEGLGFAYDAIGL